MAVLGLLVLILAMTGHSSASWCICKDGLGDSTLQKTLDYACGAGADCGPIHQNGACYNPNTVRAHCSYAVDNYFQRKGQAQGSCDFSGTASLSASDPSYTGCVYPSSASGLGTGSTPVTTTPSSTTKNPSTTTTTPYSTTPTGVLGGIGPSGTVGINSDDSYAGISLNKNYNCLLCLLLALSCILASFQFGKSS